MDKEVIRGGGLQGVKVKRLTPVLGSTVKSLGLALLAACAPDVPPSQEGFVNECDDPAVLDQYTVSESTPLLELPVCVHFVFPDQASYETSWQAGEDASRYLQERLDNLNMQLAGKWGTNSFDEDSRIQVVSVQEPNIVISPEWAGLFELYDDEEEMHRVAAEMKQTNNSSGCVNYYMMDDPEPLNTGMPAAFANMPGNPEEGGIVTRDADSNDVAHEFGHILGLYHTHETKFGDSVVHPNEPYTTGDLLKDTPPDPGQSGWNTTTGEYTAGCTLDEEYNYETSQNEQYLVCDEEFAGIEEDVPYTNRMSYYHYDGYQTFTDEQRQRMHCTWDRHEADIVPE